MDVITTGLMPLNPSEDLASKSCEKFINEIRNDYDYTFLDSAPVGIVTDANII